MAIIFYFSYSIHHSVGNKDGWADLLQKTRANESDYKYYGEAQSSGNNNPIHYGNVVSASPLKESLIQK